MSKRFGLRTVLTSAALVAGLAASAVTAGAASASTTGHDHGLKPQTFKLVQVTDIQKFKNTTNAVASNVNTVTVPDTPNYYDIGANRVPTQPGVTFQIQDKKLVPWAADKPCS